MDIVKIKDIGSQILMYKGQKHSKVKFKETTKTPERYYWTVNSKLLVCETFEVHSSDLTQNKLAIDIPALYY